MKTSVVMATYNGEEFLTEQLDSLRTQTMPPDEVVFCDDVSTDKTPERIEEYIRKYGLEKTWHLYRNEKNLGYADNFHAALQKAHGEYIFFCDQDDVWLPEKTEETLRVMEQHPKIQLLCSDFAPLVSSGDAPKLSQEVLDSMKDDGSLEEIVLDRKNIFIGCLGCVMCLRKSFRDRIEPYWFSGWAHDEYVWKLAQCMKGCYRYHKVLIQRRLHGHNVSMKKFHENGKRIRFLKLLLESHKKTLECAKAEGMDAATQRMIRNNIRSVELRLELLEKHRWQVIPSTFRYQAYYHSRKSLLMEPYMALVKKDGRKA